MKEILSEVFIS